MSIAKWLLAKKLGGGSPFPPVIKRKTGNPIEFTDGADAPLVKCVTQITGSQDLHGQDKPWVGGAGNNKLPNNATSTTVDGVLFVVVDDGTITATGTSTGWTGLSIGTCTLEAGTWYLRSYVETDYAKCYLEAVGGGSTYNTYAAPSKQMVLTETTTLTVKLYVPSGQTVNNVVCKPIIYKDGASPTYTPYSNICPITAYTEGEIEVRGKNLANQSDFVQGSINGVGEDISSTYRLRSPLIPVLPNTDYTFSTNSELLVMEINRYDSNGTWQGLTTKNATSTTYTIPNNIYYIKVLIRKPDNSTITPSELTKFQMEKGSTATDYEPYTSTTHTTTYPSAIYRGSEDCVKGEVTAEWKKVVFDGTENWQVSYQNGHYRYTNVAISDIKKPSANNVPVHAVTNIYQVRAADLTYMGYDGFSVQSGTSGVVYIYDSRFDAENKLADFKSALSQENLEVAYELATPTTSSVTPTNLPIKSLFGYNHIESSTGDMVVDYITDAYQNFVDTVESALPNTRKGGVKAFDIFATLDNPSTDPEPDKDSDEGDKKEEVKEETKDDMR